MSICEIQVSISVGQICFVDVIIIDLPIQNHDLVEVLLDLRGLWGVLWQATGEIVGGWLRLTQLCLLNSRCW